MVSYVHVISFDICFKVESFFLDGFYKDCPDGLLTQKQFILMYNHAFPDGDATQYAKRVFATFDRDDSGLRFFSLSS